LRTISALPENAPAISGVTPARLASCTSALAPSSSSTMARLPRAAAMFSGESPLRSRELTCAPSASSLRTRAPAAARGDHQLAVDVDLVGAALRPAPATGRNR
jgi:hypothetical protein